MSSSKRMIAVLLAVLCFLTLLAGCASGDTRGPGMYADVSASSSGSRMQLVEATIGSLSRNISGEGVVLYPDEEQITFAPFAGKTLVEVYVKNGDSVQPGDLLAEFEAVYSEADLESLRSNLEITKKQFEIQRNSLSNLVSDAEQNLANAKKAKASGMGSANDVRRAQLRLESAQIDLDGLDATEANAIKPIEEAIADFEADIANTKLIAERAGIIDDVAYYSAGTLVTPDMVLCTIYSPDVFWLGTSSDTVNTMRYNQPVTITVTKESKEYHGRIVASPNILGGVSGRVTILPEDIESDRAATFTDRMKRITVLAPRFSLDNVLIVPISAVGNEEGSRFVYIYEDGVVGKRYVTVGMQDASNIQILDGLEPGQIVVAG